MQGKQIWAERGKLTDGQLNCIKSHFTALCPKLCLTKKSSYAKHISYEGGRDGAYFGGLAKGGH
jgi:hypothetical protein